MILEGRAAKVIDATCPFVTGFNILPNAPRRIGRDVVVAGNPDHPEMIGVVGYAPHNTYVVRDAGGVAGAAATAITAGGFANDNQTADFS